MIPFPQEYRVDHFPLWGGAEAAVRKALRE
jgi:hypothetical protein